MSSGEACTQGPELNETSSDVQKSEIASNAPFGPLGSPTMGDRGVPTLSAASRAVWAKYDEPTGAWLPLYQHMLDSADVAARLWDEWLPGNVCDAIATCFGGEELGRKVFVWLAGIHDIGKAAPSFAEKAEQLLAKMVDLGLPRLPGRNSDIGQHWIISHVVLSQWLQQDHGFERSTAEALGAVLGGHHGNPPGSDQLGVFKGTRRLGAPAWGQVRHELLGWFAGAVGIDEHLPHINRRHIPKTIQVLLSAGVIVADWIASNTDFFPLVGPGGGTMPDRGLRGWEALGLPPAWEPPAPPRDPGTHLRARFPFLTEARPLQTLVLEESWRSDGPGLMIVEAPMGAGKTEAALGAAEILAHRFGCSGVLVALPTMATSDAMFGRVRQWIEHLPGGGGLTTFLAHGKAGLNDEYVGLPSDQSVSGLYDDADESTAVAVAHSWLRGRKKGVLATFVVATIDQVLFGALKSRHLALRHLALAGKVVVVDEVHAADDYMRAYLSRVLHWLGAYGVPVVLLSATLPPQQREELAAAYESGQTPPRPEGGVDFDAL